MAGNGEQEWYINANDAATASVKPWSVDSSGILHIQAAPASSTLSPLINGYQYTSGELNSYHSFSQTYGLFEVRAKLPSGQGFWPAFWLLPEDGSWPPELDVMEALGNNAATIYTTAHSNTLSGGQESKSVGVANTSAWHTYAVDWEPDFITWYVDGAAVYRVATPADMNKPMYMVLNLAVGGYWPGNANATTNFANDMEVDWVKVYQSTANTGATALLPTVTHYTSTITASGGAIALGGSSAWTDAEVLSTGAVALVAAKDDGWGSHVGVAGVYNPATGTETTAFQLFGYAANGAVMDPHVTSLAGGFWEVSYTGVGAPAGFEVYNAAGKQVFIDNQWVAGTPTFTPLDNGASLISDPSWGRFYVTGTNGVINWFSEDRVNGVLTAPSHIQSLNNGGWVFGYQGSSQIDVYSASGALINSTHLGAAGSSFASASASTELPGGGFAMAWLAQPADGSYAMQVTFDTFNAAGVAVTAATNVALDLDPWHTEMKVLETGQPQEALLLWSQGGAIWAALAQGTTVGAAKVLNAGTLDTFTETALSDGKVALTWVQTDNGVSDVWAEVLDPTNMSLTQHLLGAGTGGARVVATANGGFAVSWHNGAAIDAVGYHGLDGYGDVSAVSGDFIGLDSSGLILAVGQNASGGATLQHYSLGVDPLTGH